MKCAEVRQRIDEYIDGELLGEDAQAFADHIESCPGCRAFFEEEKEAAAFLSSLKAEPPDFITPVIEKLKAEKRARRRRGRYLSVAAAFVVCLVGAVYMAANAPMETEGAAITSNDTAVQGTSEAVPAQGAENATEDPTRDMEVQEAPAGEAPAERGYAQMVRDPRDGPESSITLEKEEFQAFIEGYGQRFSGELDIETDGEQTWIKLIVNDENVDYVRGFSGLEDVSQGDWVAIYEDIGR